MIQDGPLPSFLDEEQLQRLLSDTTPLTEMEKQFQSGFAFSGLLEVNVIYLIRKLTTVEAL